MKIVVADTSALISLGHAGHIRLISQVFGEFYIAGAVWNEIRHYDHSEFDRGILTELAPHVVNIRARNDLSMVLDYGESESVILYDELLADYLLIDDNKARTIAESLNVNCIGSIGLLIKAKEKGLISALRPTFKIWLSTGRYFSVKLLNKILEDLEENPLEI